MHAMLGKDIAALTLSLHGGDTIGECLFASFTVPVCAVEGATYQRSKLQHKRSVTYSGLVRCVPPVR